jgi:hypothetical protein
MGPLGNLAGFLRVGQLHPIRHINTFSFYKRISLTEVSKKLFTVVRENDEPLRNDTGALQEQTLYSSPGVPCQDVADIQSFHSFDSGHSQAVDDVVWDENTLVQRPLNLLPYFGILCHFGLNLIRQTQHLKREPASKLLGNLLNKLAIGST